MKAAKNMDSVFANCTQDELDFDVLFDNDDTIIDFIAGVDEAGVPVTGPDFDYSKILAEADMLEDPDDEKEREGKVNHNTAPEGSKDTDLEVGGEVGDGKEVTGKEKSSESEAHDMVKLGSETAQQTAVQKAMEIAAKKFADQKEECCKENSEYEGYSELVEAVVNGFMSEDEIMSENASQIAIATADYLIKECADAKAREGKVDPDNKGNVEGVKSEVIDNQTKGSASGDPIADDCDQAARDGKVVPDKNVEGIATRIIGAAMESASGDIHKDIDDQTLDNGIESMNKDIVPDSVQVNTDANNIDIKQEAVSHDEHVEDAYKDLIGGMRVGLQKLALADAVEESVMESAVIIAEMSEEQNIPVSECAGFDTIVEAVVAAMSEDQINMENAATFVVETAEFIIQEMNARQAKKMGKTQAEIAQKLEKRAVQSVQAGGVKAAEKAELAHEALDKAIKVNAHAGKENVVAELQGLKEELKNVQNPEKKMNIIQKIFKWIKENPMKAGVAIVGGSVVITGAAVAAAKAIANKKKAQEEKQEEVKENYEYPEYKALVEAVISDFTEEEIMAENASDMACAVADILIEKAEKMNADDIIGDENDDADIEAIANGEEPEVNLHYDYDDDELIDMVDQDQQL